MACNRFTVLTLLLAVVHAADECESQSFVNFGFLGLIQQALERMELTSVLPGTLANRYIETYAFAVLPDLLALLIAAGVFYFLSSAMQVPKRERKPSEQNSDVEEESSIDLSQIPEISGCTPLHWAAHNGLYRDVEILLTSGANVNATDNYLETPLHMAARCGYVDICDILLGFGADPRVLNKNQKTPLLIAALSGHSEICDLLSPVKLARRPAPVKGLAIKETKLEQDTQDVSSDSTAASSPRTEDEELTFGCNDLHWAALRCSLPEIRVALAKQIPVDSTDPWGDTALHLATRVRSVANFGSPKLVLVLNMLIGILCEVVNTVTTVEKEEMTVLFVTNKLQKVLDELDSNNDGQLSKEEFEHILQVPAAARALEEVGVDPVSIVDCGNFIFGEGGGTDLPFKKFMEVLLTLRADNKCTLRDVISLRGQVKSQLDTLVHRLCADLPNILGLRKAQVPHSRQQTGEISVEHESAEREDDAGGAELRALEAKTDSLEGTMEEILGKLSLLSQHFEKPTPVEVAAVPSERPLSGVSSLRKTAQVEAFYLPKRDYAKEELLRSFRMRDSRRYLVALELALDAELDFEQIPCVYRLYRLAETFMLPHSEVPDASGKITAQLCLILDYGVSDGAAAAAEHAQRMARVKKSLEQIVDDVKKFRNPSFPDASVDLELTAIAYSDWDEIYGRPAVAAFGGREVNSAASGPWDFNLGGQFTRDPLELQRWMGSGRAGRGSPCRELAGAWWTAAQLPWKAQKKLALVITDAPCYGKDYSSVAAADSRCDPRSGLTCTGRPEEPLKRLKDQGVVVSILHSGSAGAVSMCHTLQASSPELSHSKVHPSETARGLAHALEEQLHLQPLTYILKPHMLELSAETQLPPDSNLCVAHEMEVDVGGQTQRHTISSDGLFFLGSHSCSVTLQRPPDEKLDAFFERRSQAVELDGFFNGQKSYLLKMPPLRSAHGAEHFDVRKVKVAK